MKVTFITTVLNEEKNIISLLDSLLFQAKRADEIIIVDGGSKDNTVSKIEDWVSKLRSKEFAKRIKMISKKGNRSVGRNEAIRRAESDIIVSSDAGCILDRNWIKNIASSFKNPRIDVVSGYYKGLGKSVFEKSLIPYVLVMPDKIKADNFLPSARSMAFRKSVWEKVGGFPLEYYNNEDYVFSRKLRKYGARIVFKKNAFVYYIPRENLLEAFIMFFRFAKGDGESGVLRPKVTLILVRYFILAWLLIYASYFRLTFILETIFYILLLYILWSIWKNYRYVKDREAVLFLPLIQFTSDVAVIIGTLLGFIKGIWDTQGKR